jgi:retron-type reverse transcriptase
MKTAKIRLIPKKGDLTKIGNWRPISLLSCFYKIISRTFANRLQPVMDKITSVGQKGYSKTKQCQEVLISIINGISKCKKNKIKGAILSLDIKKAFDSISHSYLRAALKFFNFGDNFIRNILTLSTGRRASIILEDSSLGKFFDLERGNAQGDTISPYLFNIGYQILLLKINFDLQIKGFLDVPDKFRGDTQEGAQGQAARIPVPDTVRLD